MKSEKQCERCEHNYEFVHCCVMRDMSEALKTKCDGFIKRKPKTVIEEQPKKKFKRKPIDYANDERFANSFGRFLLKGGAYSLRTNSRPFEN